jgi:succinate dehydrogenase/fumarate reductase flavoprotein subunit
MKGNKWRYNADVEYRYGGAGACAAIEVIDAGAEDFILEKMLRVWRSNTIVVDPGLFNLAITPKRRCKRVIYDAF